MHCWRAAAFQRTGPTRVGPVATQPQPVLDVGVVVFQPFAGRAAIDVLLGQIGEVLPRTRSLRPRKFGGVRAVHQKLR